MPQNFTVTSIKQRDMQTEKKEKFTGFQSKKICNKYTVTKLTMGASNGYLGVNLIWSLNSSPANTVFLAPLIMIVQLK